MTDEGLVVHMLIEKKYPLKKEIVMQMLKLKLESEDVKHFEDMRLCRPSKEYLPVWFDPPRDVSMLCLTTKGMRNNGTKCARLQRSIQLGLTTASTPLETSKPLMKDESAEDVDVHLYRSMIGSLMYLTSSRPDIMFVDSPFDLEAYSNSDYAGVSLDRKSTTRGCQFLRSRLISWQCKKQTIVVNSTTEAEYVVAASCCGQVLWIQNQILDYGYKFMNTKIFIDNESTICIAKNPVYHSKTKHIEIRHHFIRDSNEKKLI
ncbi:hypothetical protein Tco_0080378 [Tanacetum coccineum]